MGLSAECDGDIHLRFDLEKMILLSDKSLNVPIEEIT